MLANNSETEKKHFSSFLSYKELKGNQTYALLVLF